MTDDIRKRFLDKNVPPIVEAIDAAVNNLVKELGDEGADAATLFTDLFVALVAVMAESGQNYPQQILDAAYVDAVSLHREYDPAQFLALFTTEPAVEAEDARFALPSLVPPSRGGAN